jgi:hypothetical protein
MLYTLYKHNKTIQSVHSFEKLCHVVNANQDFDITKVILTFTLKNTPANKVIFFSNMILLEKIIGQKLCFVRSSEHNQNFNIRKGTKLGCKLTLRGDQLHRFLLLFFTYSVRKLNLFYKLAYSKSMLNKLNNKLYTTYNYSLKKILFFLTISNSTDWDNFSYIYDEVIYGLDISFFTKYNNNPYINRLILSHYGLGIL